MLNSCIFAVQLADASLLPAIEGRLSQLERFYAPLGPTEAVTRWSPGARALAGRIRFGGGSRAPLASNGRGGSDEPLAWGAPLPRALRSNEALLEASDAELRALDHSIAAVGARDDRVRVVCGAAGATALHAATSTEAACWSSHAVAAAWLAAGRVEVDPEAIPELVSAQMLGGERTLLRGATAVAPATRIELEARGASTRSYWPARERWEPVPEHEAHAAAEDALVHSLEGRLAGATDVWCGLTAGLDSRVAALGLSSAGVDFRAFTWNGLPGDEEDARTAAEVARALEVEHSLRPYERYPDEETTDRIDANVRWSEGLMPMGFGHPTRPPSAHAYVTGEGGETGRAYYYRDSTRAHPRPHRRALATIVWDSLHWGLDGAPREVRRAVRRRTQAWVTEAQDSGLDGWRLLDVLYADQVVGRWGRAMLPLTDAQVVAAFAAPEVARALCSLPLYERITDGFHRRFVADRAPQLAPPPREPGGLGRIRYAEARLRAPLRRLRGPRPAPPSELAPEFTGRPRFREWVTDEVLASPLLEEALGARWTREVREAFLAGRGDGLERAVWAAAPVALQLALADLGRPGTVRSPEPDLARS